MLSISAVKADSSGEKKAIDNWRTLSDQIVEQIGERKYNEVIKSKEFLELYDKNKQIFDMVDWIKDNLRKDDPAYVVDSLNFERFKLKIAIQEKFFNSMVSETKHGY
jgi:hypothetical protein